MTSPEIVLGDQAGLPLLTQAFNNGFVDYKYGTLFNEEQMEQFLYRSNMKMANCAVLVVEGENGLRGEGVALLSLHGGRGWCGGLAVAPTLRQQGWAHRLMLAIQHRAQACGAQTMQLEVLVENLAAQRLYRSLGYRYTRELWIWQRDPGAAPSGTQTRLVSASADTVLAQLDQWRHGMPVWQRLPVVLERMGSDLRGLLAHGDDGELLGALLVSGSREQQSRRLRVAECMLNPQADPKAGSRLLCTLAAQEKQSILVLLNEPADSPLNIGLSAAGFRVIERQYEMDLSLVD